MIFDFIDWWLTTLDKEPIATLEITLAMFGAIALLLYYVRIKIFNKRR